MDREQLPLLQVSNWRMEEFRQAQPVIEQELPTHSEGQEPGGGPTLSATIKNRNPSTVYITLNLVVSCLHVCLLFALGFLLI